MTATRTGIAKGTLWVFYREAQAASYTPIIKVSWHAAGVVPYSPDASLTRLPAMEPPGLFLKSAPPLEHSSFPDHCQSRRPSPAGAEICRVYRL